MASGELAGGRWRGVRDEGAVRQVEGVERRAGPAAPPAHSPGSAPRTRGPSPAVRPRSARDPPLRAAAAVVEHRVAPGRLDRANRDRGGGRPRDAQPSRWRRRPRRGTGGRARGCPPRVTGRRAGHHVEQRGGVGDGAGERPTGRVPALPPGRPRDPASRRLEPDQPAPGRRDADRATAVEPSDDRAQPGREGGRRLRPRSRPGCGPGSTGCDRSGTRAISVVDRDPNSGVLVLPRTTNPAAPDAGDHLVVVVGNPLVPRRGAVRRADARRCRRGP